MNKSGFDFEKVNNFFEGSIAIEDVVITREFIHDEEYDSTLYFLSIKKSDNIVKPSFLLVHGFGEHTGRYLEFGCEMAKSGFDFYAYDCRGFGHSSGARSSTLLREYFEDIIIIMGYINKGTPLYMLGHSTGGGVLLSFFKLNPNIKVSGLILSNPFLNFHPRAKANFSKRISLSLLSKFAGVNYIIYLKYPRNLY
jgi:alpha-beta hydrolase superfamily lysophospholipase